MKRAALALAALAAACAAVTCVRAPKPPVRDALYRHLGGDPRTLDPTTTSEELGMRVEELIFRPLVGLDKNRRFVRSLATSWAVSSDGLVYDFRLDPKARWEDGSPVTSADVAYTIERVRDPRVPAVGWRWGFEDVAAVETPDSSTVIVRFQKPYAERLLAFTIPIVSAAAYAQLSQADRHPAGSGPYRLASWIANQGIELERRADADAAAYPFRRIVFRVIPDSSVRFRAGTRGELDEFVVTRDQVAAAQRSTDFVAHDRLFKVPQFLVVLVVWNCRHPFLADARVRRALALSWPREEAARRLYPPEGAKLISGPYPPGAPENAADVAPVRSDPAAAARLLDEVGVKMGPDGFRRRGGRRFTFELLSTSAYPIYRSLEEILREACAKVGIELVVRSLDWAAYTQRLAAGEFDAAIMGNIFLPPNLDPYSSYHSSQAPPNGSNYGFYRNAQADRAMEAARREMDAGRRLELYRQIHRLLAADPPADFLWDADQYWGVSKSLAGVEVSPLGLFHFLPGPLGWKPFFPSK